ncbi:MAG: PEP-CTERM sorting domain-containing protein [Sedimenticolaceae bacterium]
MKNKSTSTSATCLAGVVLLFASSAQAVPVLHQFFLEDSGGSTVYTGTVTVDSSRLTPSTFTPFSDAGFLAFSLTIGSESWSITDASNPTTEGIITDATGMIVSFFDNTAQSATFLLNGNSERIDIVENNAQWSTSATATVMSGPTHSFARAAVPAPLTLSLLGVGLLGMSYRRAKQRA